MQCYFNSAHNLFYWRSDWDPRFIYLTYIPSPPVECVCGVTSCILAQVYCVSCSLERVELQASLTASSSFLLHRSKSSSLRASRSTPVGTDTPYGVTFCPLEGTNPTPPPHLSPTHKYTHVHALHRHPLSCFRLSLSLHFSFLAPLS